MNCPSCGRENPAEASFCMACTRLVPPAEPALSPSYRSPGSSGFVGANGRDIVKSGPIAHENGFLPIPDRPGIGVELAEDAYLKYPPKTREIFTRLHVDGPDASQGGK